jgi:protein-disulfide isomerase
MQPTTKISLFEDKFVIGIVIFTILILVIGGIFLSKFSNGPTMINKEQTKEVLSVKSDDWIKGTSEAPITIVEYLDFECEACRVYYPITKRLQQEYQNKVRFIVRYFPLPGHKNSMTSASAAEAAGRQGKFWEMHDLLYENQKSWGEKKISDPSLFTEYAKQIGLDMEKYSKDINSQEVIVRINRDKNSGGSLGISGTPTFFINGEKIPNPKGYEDFKSIIDGLTPTL